jgi:electron transport complex protein RnfC
LTFKGGLHLHFSREETEKAPIEVCPLPEKVIVPLLQHNGDMAKPLVQPGDHVSVGETIAESIENNSLTMHASISGIVTTVGLLPHPSGKDTPGIEIENDGMNEKFVFHPFEKPWREAAPGELIQKIQSLGISDLSSEGIPTHIKLSPPSNQQIHTLIINGIDPEPYIASDLRIIIEKTEEFLDGVLIAKKIIGASKVIIALEDKRHVVIQSITSWLADTRFREIQVAIIQSKFPHGNDKQLIDAITKKKVPSGKPNYASGAIVLSAGTALALYNGIINGEPFYQRLITVSGSAVKRPKNLLVRIGTPLKVALNTCGVDMKDVQKVIIGGPMMGITQTDLSVPIIKTTTGITVLNQTTPALESYPCIKCGRCSQACPIHLIPDRLCKFIKKNKIKETLEWNIMDCIECGACAYNCPAKINLVHYIRLGKLYGNKLIQDQKQMSVKGN